ncbi:hypothetical protein OE88DRAFT_1667666 [Heliocybe sulcata]|uniref:MYND-type domain-containing protein n=1 Tax=Heliocybe sulcata TaxID=5364 RepID=A0A5C3MM15_9AGAM|nr:hypothetical protein OE88DRAFT_1667666 [Heliocybe sulcata]
MDVAPDRCKVCRATEDLMQCSRCKGEHYCCRKHQVSDWKQHKPLCWQLKPPSLGETVYIIGMLLPYDEEEPRLVKIRCEVKESRYNPGGLVYSFDKLQFFVPDPGWGVSSRNRAAAGFIRALPEWRIVVPWGAS